MQIPLMAALVCRDTVAAFDYSLTLCSAFDHSHD